MPTPSVEDVPELVAQIQGAPRADDDFERTVLFHSFAIQMNLISPLWFAIRAYRQMRGQDGVGPALAVLTLDHARHKTSMRWTWPYRAWNRRSGSCLAQR